MIANLLVWASLVRAAEPVALDPSILRALSLRDGTSCASLGVSDADQLVRYTDPTLQPPSVPVRASACLVERFPESVANIALPWMTDPERVGLALVVLNGLDRLPEPSALQLARAALANPDLAPRATRFVRAAALPSVRDLAPAPAPKSP